MLTITNADKLLTKDVTKQRITEEDAAKARERISTAEDIGALHDVDFVIEAVPVHISLIFSSLSKLGVFY